MDKSEVTNTIIVESDSRLGEFYSVNIRLLTCSCQYFCKKLHILSLEDPHRLCKHLVKALAVNSVPEYLKQYTEDIEWFAKHNASFTSKEKVQRDKRLPLPGGSIITTTSEKKRKYCYVKAVANEKKISVAIPLAGGLVSFTINNLHATCDLNSQRSFMPWQYKYMEQAIINWIVDEYNKVKNTDAPIATKKIIEYKPNPDPIPEGSIKTILIEKYDTSSGILMLPDGVHVTEDGEEYYHAVGEINDNQIEAFISSQSTSIFYSINRSRIYSFDVSPLLSETEVNLTGIETNALVKVVITIDSPDKFPRHYHYMEKAVIKWLTDEYNKILSRAM